MSSAVSERLEDAVASKEFPLRHDLMFGSFHKPYNRGEFGRRHVASERMFFIGCHGCFGEFPGS